VRSQQVNPDDNAGKVVWGKQHQNNNKERYIGIVVLESVHVLFGLYSVEPSASIISLLPF